MARELCIYLRGIQESDSSGSLSFTTIFPGCYPGR